MSSPPDIVELLREASQAYYSGKQLTMDDDTYDGIVERLRELDPRNAYLHEVGSAPPDSSMKQLICITGTRDKELEQKLAEKGLQCTTILSASITILVVPDTPTKETGKIRVAKELGMKVLTRSQFTQQYLS